MAPAVCKSDPRLCSFTIYRIPRYRGFKKKLRLETNFFLLLNAGLGLIWPTRPVNILNVQTTISKKGRRRLQQQQHGNHGALLNEACALSVHGKVKGH